MSAAAGVFAAAQLHEMTIAAGDSGTTMEATSMDATAEQGSQQIKQRVIYSTHRAVQNPLRVTDDI